MILLPSKNSRRHQSVNARPPVVDIKFKPASAHRGRPTMGYSIGTAIYDIENLQEYIYGPVEWMALFAHAPNNVHNFAYSYKVGDENRKFTPAYFKGEKFSLVDMAAYLKYSDDYQETTYQGLNKDRTVVVKGPIWRRDDVYTFLKVLYFGRKGNFLSLNLHDFIRATTKTSNTDDYCRRLFHICNGAKTTIATREDDALPELPLYELRHSSGRSFIDMLEEASSLANSRERILELCKESILDFGGLGIESSYARRLSRGEKKNQLKYNGHMTRYYNPDISISLGEVPEILKDCGFTATEQGSHRTTLSLSTIRLLTALAAHVPSSSEKPDNCEKSFDLESLACLMGKRSDLFSKRSDLVNKTLAIVSAFFGKIVLSANVFKILFNVVSNGLKFSSIAQKIDDGIAEIKKIALVERFKGGFQRLKKALTDIKLDNAQSVLPNNQVPNNKQEELSRLLNLYKDKYQPMTS
ncbi:MAG: hypothetical protein KBD78_02655 [Oligoflexales bacterium]|nr:hypothetical protein [Oligoflexales bacterium]